MNRVRMFTPGGELPFAGHPTRGSYLTWLAAGGVDPADVLHHQWVANGAGLAPASHVAAQGTLLQRARRLHIEQDGDTVWVGGDVTLLVDAEVPL